MSDPVADQALERAAIYSWLADMWEAAPDAEMLRNVSEGAMASAPEAWQDVVAAARDASPEQLAEEYTRLLIGPVGHLPPFQSVWEEQQLGGAASALIRRYCDVLQIPADADHLSQCLRMQAMILVRVAESDDADARELARSFFADHLRWPPELLQAIQNRHESRFYEALASLTEAFLRTESPRFDSGSGE